MFKKLSWLAALLGALPLPALACSSVYNNPSVTLYAAASGTNDAGNLCTSSAHPCSLQVAADAAMARILTAPVLVQMAAGTYTSGINVAGNQTSGTGATGAAIIGFYGNGGSGSVKMADASSNPGAFVVSDGARIGLCGITLTSANGTLGFATHHGTIFVDQDVVSGLSHYGSWHSEYSGIIDINGGLTVDAAGEGAYPATMAPALFQPVLAGIVTFDQVATTVTFTNSASGPVPNFLELNDIEDTGVMFEPLTYLTFVGTAKGEKFYEANNGVLDLITGGTVAALPGNANGVLVTGGKIDPTQAPTVSSTGLGTGGTGSVGNSSSSDQAFSVMLTTGSALVTSTGVATVTFATNFAYVQCAQPILAAGTGGAWAAGATATITGISQTGLSITWSNNGTNLTAGGKTYYISQVCSNS